MREVYVHSLFEQSDDDLFDLGYHKRVKIVVGNPSIEEQRKAVIGSRNENCEDAYVDLYVDLTDIDIVRLYERDVDRVFTQWMKGRDERAYDDGPFNT